MTLNIYTIQFPPCPFYLSILETHLNKMPESSIPSNRGAAVPDTEAMGSDQESQGGLVTEAKDRHKRPDWAEKALSHSIPKPKFGRNPPIHVGLWNACSQKN